VVQGGDITGAAALAPAGGLMGEAVRRFDWAATPLGPIESWCAELKAAAAWVLEARFPMALAWGPELITIYNDAFHPILRGKPEALGRSFAEIWAEAWHLAGPIAERALAGESSFFQDHLVEVDRGNGPEAAYFTFCYHPVRLADGTVGGMVDTVIETTQAVRARQEMEVMRDELAHRLKNTMALVQSLAQRTLREVSDREAVKTFEKRVVALGHAHDVLGRGGWQDASLSELVEGLLATHGDRFEVEGPEIALGASATLRLSLILHELATNAAKYGALTAPDGCVTLRWQVERASCGDELILCWRERGGPRISPPSRTGFGTRLIDLGLVGTGKVERRYPAAGLEVDLRVPVKDLSER
jgi:two-component sensor histidine kinase